jgi:excinuclease UvrABC helicase subunit UvrB
VGEDASFELSADECADLFAEGLLFYQRYSRLFELHDWPRVARDTRRNLRLFDFVRRHASREEDRDYLEKWRPYLLRIHGAAAALEAVSEDAHDRALALLQTTLDSIEALPDLADPVFDFERQRSLEAIRGLLRDIERKRPVGEVERLERELRQAIAAQAFERAAELRDRLRGLRPKARD